MSEGRDCANISAAGFCPSESASNPPALVFIHRKPEWYEYVPNRGRRQKKELAVPPREGVDALRPSQDIVRLRKVAATCVSSRPKSAASELRDS